jgi:ABC-type Fe3+ transport system substrate-binding protein
MVNSTDACKNQMEVCKTRFKERNWIRLRKRSLGLVIALTMALIATSSARPAELSALLETAKKEASEGPLSLAILQPNQAATYQALFKAFNQRFGLSGTYEWQPLDSNYYVRVIAEFQAGRRTPDILTTSPGNMIALDKTGLLDAYDWIGVFAKELPAIREAVDRTIEPLRGKTLAHMDVIYTMVYNTRLVSANDVPKRIEELTNSRWQRKLTVTASGTPFNTLGIALGKERILEMARAVKANRPVYKPHTPAVVAAVVAGETPVGFGYTTGTDLEKSKGAPVDWLPLKDYIPLLQTNMAVLKGGQRPNLARLFAAWMVSDGMALQEQLEFMGRATARGTRTWQRLNDMSPKAQVVEEKTAEETALRVQLTKEITNIFTQ